MTKAPNINYDNSFKELLVKLSKNHQRFPKYLIRLLAIDYEIPAKELALLITKFTKKGKLVPLKEEYYMVKNLSK